MRIDEPALARAAAKGELSGVVTIEAGEKRLYARSYGFAHRALGVPNTLATRFALASGTKTFTAAAVLRLVELGKLELSDLVRPLLGADLPLVDDSVTIEQLLDHTSGIGDYLDEEADWDAADYILDVPVHTLAETSGFLPVIDGYPQAFAPGERFSYCNGGYILLAILIERISRMGFHDFVQEQVFDRAGMRASGFLRSDELPGDAALGYLYARGDRSNVLHLPVRGNGDGGSYSTAADLHRFWTSLSAGRILGDALRTEMCRPRNVVPDEGLSYGLGVYLHTAAGLIVMEGYDAGVSMRSMHDPAMATTATVLGNSSEGAWPVAGLLLDLATE
ncbi:MAG: serine hydrolase domain-containing protein [Propionicimonas sp.]